jgi:signal transduction histidine kinase
VLGVAAERSLYGPGDVRHWLPDLLTGWILIAAGLVAARDARLPGVLLAASGALWFAGNIAGHAAVVHRAPLAQLLLAFPRGRPEGRLETGAVAFAYAATVVAGFAWGDLGTLSLAVVLVAVGGLRSQRAVGRRRRERRYGLGGSVFFAVALTLVAGVNLLTDTASARRGTLLGYEAALAAVAVYAAYCLGRRPWERLAVTDLVVDLGETRAETVRDALARALGDPTLAVGYRLDGRPGYVDASGRPIELPPTTGRRRLTRVERQGREIAVLVHDAAVLDDPALLDAVAAATRLAAANATLQAEVFDQIRELEASRRRLLEAADNERRRLEARLHDGTVRRLAALTGALATARDAATPATAARIADAEDQLAKTTRDLRELGAGLHPRELNEQGLAVAVAALAARSPVPVELTIDCGRLPDEIEAAIFFVCSEALANVAKHANATRVSISLVAEGSRVRAEIRDDGAGGADPSGGGLRGLADRLEALRGTLEVRNEPEGGSRLTAELPY